MELTAIQCLEKSKQILDEVTDRLITKGYYMPPSYTEWGMKWEDVIIPEPTLRKFARRVAKEAKRPFVQVYRWYRYKPRISADEPWESEEVGIRLELPKRKYLAPLVNPLELAGFRRGRYIGLWSYIIEDRDFAREYLSYFETREEFRRALKLPV